MLKTLQNKASHCPIRTTKLSETYPIYLPKFMTYKRNQEEFDIAQCEKS
jgi:hypothetical protein